jgi:hypothetical protein
MITQLMAIIATAATAPTVIPAISPPVNPVVSAAVFVPAPVLVTPTDGVALPVLLLILVENTDGVESGIVVPIDSLGNALYCFKEASLGFTPEFGESNVLTQILM